MRKLRTYLLAGALSWPALSLAQDLLPPPPPPPTPLEIPALPPRTTDKPATTPTLGMPNLPPLGPVNSTLPPVNTLPPIGPTTTPPDLTPPLPPTPPNRDVSAELDQPKPMPVPMPPLKPDLGMKPYKPMQPPRDSRVPDLSGMPGLDHCPPMSCLPPMTAAPVPPPPCCPPEFEECGGPCGMYFIGEALYLRPRRGDQLAELRFSDGLTTTVTEGIFWTPNSELGYRAGVGFLTSDGLNCWAKYTWYEPDTYRQQVAVDPAAPATTTFTSTVFGLYPTIPYVAGSGNGFSFSHTFRYNTLDAMGGASFTPSEYVGLTIAGGAKLVRIDQQYDFFATVGGLQGDTAGISLDIEGAGPRFGAESRLYLCQGHVSASLYSRCYASLLWVQRRETQALQTFVGGVLSSTTVRTLHRDDHMPVLEVAGGLEVELGGCISIAAGYEWNYYWDLGSVTDVIGNSYRQDITLEGAFVRVGVLY